MKPIEFLDPRPPRASSPGHITEEYCRHQNTHTHDRSNHDSHDPAALEPPPPSAALNLRLARVRHSLVGLVREHNGGHRDLSPPSPITNQFRIADEVQPVRDEPRGLGRPRLAEDHRARVGRGEDLIELAADAQTVPVGTVVAGTIFGRLEVGVACALWEVFEEERSCWLCALRMDGGHDVEEEGEDGDEEEEHPYPW